MTGIEITALELTLPPKERWFDVLGHKPPRVNDTVMIITFNMLSGKLSNKSQNIVIFDHNCNFMEENVLVDSCLLIDYNLFSSVQVLEFLPSQCRFHELSPYEIHLNNYACRMKMRHTGYPCKQYHVAVVEKQWRTEDRSQLKWVLYFGKGWIVAKDLAKKTMVQSTWL